MRLTPAAVAAPSRVVLGFMVAAALLLASFSAAARATAAEPPKVVLVGDSIRLGYAPTVATLLAGKATVVSPEPNGGDSRNVLKHLDEWVIREKPAVVHFNCGIHDVKKTKSTGAFQVPPAEYEANLREIVARIRKQTGAVVLFAATTPILDDRAAKQRAKAEYELLQASVDQYNRIALKVMAELDVPVDDLRTVLPDAETAELITPDGVHFTVEGRKRLGKQVADFVAKHLP